MFIKILEEARLKRLYPCLKCLLFILRVGDCDKLTVFEPDFWLFLKREKLENPAFLLDKQWENKYK